MSSFIKLDEQNGGFVAIEVSGDEDERRESSGGAFRKEQFENSIEDASALMSKAVDGLAKPGIDEIKLEFGLRAQLDVGVSFWAITKVANEANVKVTVTWKRQATET